MNPETSASEHQNLAFAWTAIPGITTAKLQAHCVEEVSSRLASQG